jgi:manganese/zinc/iron transport system substrate-binding protein
LEGKMADILHQLEKTRDVYAVADTLQEVELLKIDSVADAFDPHIWFSIHKWKKCLEFAKNKINKQYPQHKTLVNQNWKEYKLSLNTTLANANKTIDSIPHHQRILVTAHDAFNYFAYDFEFTVKGLQGISTLSEYGLKDITNIIDYIIKNNIKAIHTESSISPKSIQAVIEGCKSRGHQLIQGDVLYSDALGDIESGADTYNKMYLYNIKAITKDI